MIDMHSHILFGVDDGAKTIYDSLELIKDGVKKGVSHIILTPHFKKRSNESSMDVVLNNFIFLKRAVSVAQLNVKLYLGNEVYLDSDYYDTIWNDSFNSLAGSNYVLIEFDPADTQENIPNICYELKLKGYIPVIAHVERYESIYDDRHLLSDILNEGAHLQINASSLINKESKESHKFITYLLKNQLVSFVASDTHNLNSRSSHIDKAYNAVKKLYGHSYAEKILNLNQYNILENKYFDSPKMNNINKRYLSKLFR